MAGPTLTLNKAGAAHLNQSDGTVTLSGGGLTVSQSGTSPSFTSSGAISVGSGRTLAVNRGTAQNLAGGVFQGTGTINVSTTAFTNHGVFSPGASAGILSVSGNLPQTSTAVLNAELGGTTAGSGYDRLAVSGSATLDGTLNVTLIDGFTPAPGDQFRVLTFASSSGPLFTINGLDLGGGLSLEPRYDATGLTLVAVAQTWVQLIPMDLPPDARDSHGAVYDPTGNRMVLFGGVSDAGPRNDVWVLTHANGQGGTPHWVPLSPTGGPPAARRHHSAVYDPASNRMVVYGGDDASGETPATLGDVWVLTEANGLGGTPAWVSLSPSGGPPPLRTQHTAIYDAANNRMIVFGGNPAAGSCDAGLGDVWVLSNANGLGGTPTWAELTPTGGPPSPRWSHNATYDPGSNRMTIFGGDVSCSSSNNEVWVLTDANGLGGMPAWSQLSPGGSIPDPWSLHSGVYDPSTDRFTAFGGVISTGATELVRTLSSANGASGSPTWMDLSPTSPRPPARLLHSAVQDVPTHRMIVFGGHSGAARLKDVWVLEAAAGRVVAVAPAEPPVEPPAAPALGFSRPIAPNPARGAVRFAVAVPKPQPVDLAVFDLAGRQVADLHRGTLETGEHRFEWSGVTREGRAAAAGL